MLLEPLCVKSYLHVNSVHCEGYPVDVLVVKKVSYFAKAIVSLKKGLGLWMLKQFQGLFNGISFGYELTVK
jgi:hypothetical protein